MTQPQDVTAFDELQSDSVVRVLREDPPLLYAIDLAVVVTGKDGNQAAEVIRRIRPDVFNTKKELSVRSIKFHSGIKKVRFATLKNAVKLVMAFSGKRARSFHARVADILVRHFDNKVDRFLSWMTETAEQVQEEEEARGSTTQYVYGAESEAYPGLVKIGFTSSLDARMGTANTFNAPAPFKIMAYAPTLDPRRDERMAHAFFADHRVEGEFFRVSVDEVAVFFGSCVLPLYQREVAQQSEGLD